MVKDPESDVTMTSSEQVFSDFIIGETVKARVVAINERQVLR
jgi:hypothetical protein